MLASTLGIGCVCTIAVGTLSGVGGIALHVLPPPYENARSGVVLLYWALAFLMTGCVFAAVDWFLRSPASDKAKAAILQTLLSVLPKLGEMPKTQNDNRDRKPDQAVPV